MSSARRRLKESYSTAHDHDTDASTASRTRKAGYDTPSRETSSKRRRERKKRRARLRRQNETREKPDEGERATNQYRRQQKAKEDKEEVTNKAFRDMEASLLAMKLSQPNSSEPFAVQVLDAKSLRPALRHDRAAFEITLSALLGQMEYYATHHKQPNEEESASIDALSQQLEHQVDLFLADRTSVLLSSVETFLSKCDTLCRVNYRIARATDGNTHDHRVAAAHIQMQVQQVLAHKVGLIRSLDRMSGAIYQICRPMGKAVERLSALSEIHDRGCDVQNAAHAAWDGACLNVLKLQINRLQSRLGNANVGLQTCKVRLNAGLEQFGKGSQVLISFLEFKHVYLDDVDSAEQSDFRRPILSIF